MHWHTTYRGYTVGCDETGKNWWWKVEPASTPGKEHGPYPSDDAAMSAIDARKRTERTD